MDRDDSLLELCSQEEYIQRSIDYLSQHLRPILKRHETVMICFPDQGRASLGRIFSDAVHAVGATPLICGPDYRWRTLLRQAFQRRATAIFAPPAVVLGLAKMARATKTPLSIRHVIFGGRPSSKWSVDGVKKWLDCQIHGLYSPGDGAVIAGFSCGTGYGIHMRSEEFTAEYAPGSERIVLRNIHHPDVAFVTREAARIEENLCQCGRSNQRLEDLRYADDEVRWLSELDEQLLTWGSILDYRAQKTHAGIALEVLVFPREKLPHLPSCAKLMLRAWDPEQDVPFCLENYSKIDEMTRKNS